jgi:RNA polymerase sigma-70 factor (ECF subfamily)
MLLSKCHCGLLGVKEYPVKNKPNPIDRGKWDVENIRMAQQGSPDAFAALFTTHKAKVYSLCLRMTGNSAAAEDLTQDVFLQVFRKLASFRGDSALSTWLHRVTVNTVLMHLRKKKLRQISLDEPINRAAVPQKTEHETEHAKVDERLSGAIDRIDLDRAMNELPNGSRTVFVLHEVQGHEHHEIASLLCCSVGNSKSQLYRAKTRMRKLLSLTPAEQPESRTEAPREIQTL